MTTHTSPFLPMVNIVRPGVLPSARVEHFAVSDEESRMTAVRAWRRDEFVPPGNYARLYVGRALVMSDTPMEQRSNIGVVSQARTRQGSRVLIGGLGLGMVIAAMLNKAGRGTVPDSITVVEKSADVIALVAPALLALPGARGRLTIVEGDITTWKAPKGAKWDVIYFDIWADVCEDNLPEMGRLHQRFARRKLPGGWMGSWKREELLYRRRSSRW